MIELVMVKAEECRPLRQAWLRPDQPPEECIYPGDDDDRTLHLTMKKGETVYAILSMFHEPRGDVGSEVWRLRGVAVDPEHRREGLGRKVMLAAQAVAEKRGGGMWANVRQGAVAFYEAHGFGIEGEEFELPGIGPHVVMTWRPAP